MLQCHLDTTGIQVADNHLAATCFEHLHGKLSNHTKTDNNEALAKCRMGTANSLHGNRAKCNSTCLFKRNGFRNLHEQVAWYIDNFCMMCALRSGTSNTLADLHVTYICTNTNDNACRRVTNKRTCIQLPFHNLSRLGDSLLRNHIKDFFYFFGFFQCAFPERDGAGTHTTHLRTNRDTRIDNMHEYLIFFHLWSWHFFCNRPPFFDQYLLHAKIPRVSMTVFPLRSARSIPLNSL